MSETPKLPGYQTFPDIAAKAGVTKQMVHKCATENGEFGADLFAVGSKPVYVVTDAGVERWLAERAEKKADREQRKADKEAAAERRAAAKEAKA